MNAENIPGFAEADGKKIKTLADREAELLAKRNKLAIARLIFLLEDPDASFLKLQESRAENFQDVVLALAYQFGTFSGTQCESISGAFIEAMNMISGNAGIFLVHAWECVSRTISSRLQQEINQTLDRITDRTAREFCGILNWDYPSEFFQPAAEDIPPGRALLAARKAAVAGR